MQRQQPDMSETDKAMDAVLAWAHEHRPEWVDFLSDLTKFRVQIPNQITGSVVRAMILVGYRAGQASKPRRVSAGDRVTATTGPDGITNLKPSDE